MFFLIVIVSLFFYYALSVKAFTDNATYLSDVGFLARVWAVLLLLGEFLFSFADFSLMILVLGSKFFTGDSTLFLFEGVCMIYTEHLEDLFPENRVGFSCHSLFSLVFCSGEE